MRIFQVGIAFAHYKGCIGSAHIRWELSPAKSRRHAQALTINCSSRNQRGRPLRRHGTTATQHPYAHAFNTVHSTDVRRFRATHQRSSTFSLHPKDIREEYRFEESAVRFGMAYGHIGRAREEVAAEVGKKSRPTRSTGNGS